MANVRPLMEDNFMSLAKDRSEIMARLSEDIDLAKCLLCNDKRFKDYSPTPEDIESIPYKFVFPCPYTFDTTQESKSFITMAFKYSKSSSSNVWKVGNITLWCYCSKDIVQTPYGLRYDYMLQRVNKLLFDTRNSTWIGKMEFIGMEDVIMNDTYVGVMVRYKNAELM